MEQQQFLKMIWEKKTTAEERDMREEAKIEQANN